MVSIDFINPSLGGAIWYCAHQFNQNVEAGRSLKKIGPKVFTNYQDLELLVREELLLGNK